MTKIIYHAITSLIACITISSCSTRFDAGCFNEKYCLITDEDYIQLLHKNATSSGMDEVLIYGGIRSVKLYGKQLLIVERQLKLLDCKNDAEKNVLIMQDSGKTRHWIIDIDSELKPVPVAENEYAEQLAKYQQIQAPNFEAIYREKAWETIGDIENYHSCNNVW